MAVLPPTALLGIMDASRDQGSASAVEPPQHLLRQWTGRLRGRYLLAVDLAGITLAAYLAVVLRFDRMSAPALVPTFPLAVVLLLAVRTTVNISFGLYSRRWLHASVPELERIVGAVAVGSLATIAIFYGAPALVGASWADGFPRSFWPIELLLSVAAVGVFGSGSGR